MANQELIFFIKQLKNALWLLRAKRYATSPSNKTNNNKHSDRDGFLSRTRTEKLVVFYEAEFCIHHSNGMCFQFPDKLRPKSD